MVQTIDAIYENGVFRPQEPVNVANGERVSLTVSPKTSDADLRDVADLLDLEYMEACRRDAGEAPTLEEARKALNAFKGSLADVICEERDER
jgi:predicted DNA-binding antitoxin AbrB/MazE fold protein